MYVSPGHSPLHNYKSLFFLKQNASVNHALPYVGEAGIFYDLYGKAYKENCASRDARYAADCFLRARSYEADNLPHSDEERLSLRGELGAELPW